MNASRLHPLLAGVLERHRLRGSAAAIGEATSLSTLFPTTEATLRQLLPERLEQAGGSARPQILVQVNRFRPMASELMQALWASVGAEESALAWRSAGVRPATPHEVQPTGWLAQAAERFMTYATSVAATGSALVGAAVAWSSSAVLLAHSDPYLELIVAVPDVRRVGGERRYTYVVGMLVDSVFAHDGDWLLEFGYQKRLASMTLDDSGDEAWRFSVTHVRAGTEWRPTSLVLGATARIPDRPSLAAGGGMRLLDIAAQPMLGRRTDSVPATYAVSEYEIIRQPLAARTLRASLFCDDEWWCAGFGLASGTAESDVAVLFERYRVGLSLPRLLRRDEL